MNKILICGKSKEGENSVNKKGWKTNSVQLVPGENGQTQARGGARARLGGPFILSYGNTFHHLTHIN